RVAHFGFAREFRLRQTGHADHRRRKRLAVKMRLRPGGKLRPFHTNVSTAGMHPVVSFARPRRSGNDLPEIVAERIRERHMPDATFTEKTAGAHALGPVEDLIGNDHVAW